MAKPIFVDWCPKDVLDGVQTLEPMEELAYRRILDLIYVTGDNLPDDDKRLAWMTKAGRKWTAIKSTLIEMGKIEIIGGRISNHRCRETLQKTAQKIDQKREAGIASAEKRKSQKNNENPSTGAATGVTTSVPTTQEPKNPIVGGGGGSARDTDREAIAQSITERFEELRRELWPNESGFPAPRNTLRSQALAYLDLGATVPLDETAAVITEVMERGMRQSQATGKRPTVSLLAFKNSIPDAIASHRAGIQIVEGTPHVPGPRQNPTEFRNGFAELLATGELG